MIVPRGLRGSWVRGIAVASDGAIFVVGSSDGAIWLLRLLADGTPDQDFGDGGLATTEVSDCCPSLELSVVEPTSSGARVTASDPADSTAAQLDRIDFARRGEVVSWDTITLPDLVESPRAIELRPDGGFVVAGQQAIARYTASNELDPEYGAGGVTTVDTGFVIGDRALASHPDGRLYIKTGPLLIRVLADGIVDPSFDGLDYLDDGRLCVTASGAPVRVGQSVDSVVVSRHLP